jgi:hypothetical protein
MRDLVDINSTNEKLVKAWKPTPTHPHAVVRYTGANVHSVTPVESKVAAEDLVAQINQQPGDRGQVLLAEVQ